MDPNNNQGPPPAGPIPENPASDLRTIEELYQPTMNESVFQAWERFKSYLRKCPDHIIILVDQILTLCHGITMIDREKIMVAAGGNIMHKSEIDPLIRESTDTFLMGDEEIKLNSHKDIDDLVPIPRAFEKLLDSHDPISKTFDMTITNPLFDFDSEFTLNSDNPIFDIQIEESDESETETIMEEVQIHSSQSTAQIPPSYEKLNFDLTMPIPILTFS
ncbi:hypothetical protein Tco_1216254 [Tanacetum coccineum]